MNKRVLHLFNNAGFHFPEMERLGIEPEFDKFVKLIIEECVNHIKTVENTPAGFIQPKHSSVLEFELKRHFGTAT